MEDPNELSNDFDRRFEQQTEQSEKLYLECRLRSGVQLAKEYTRLARQQQRVVSYMCGLFDLMRFQHGMLAPQQVREAAVELVVLLQDEEQARRIQPDLDEAQYHWVCSWMSTCAYDNLAESTGLMAGFNSPGMHECISDGLQVCRQTGKVDCIKCFREYAADVYLAADDFAMVRHQCQSLLEFREDDENARDRRPGAYQKLAWVNLLEGRFLRANRDLEQAQNLSGADQVYLRRRTIIESNLSRHEIRLLLGQTVAAAPEGLPQFESGEWPRQELELAKLDALSKVMTGKIDEAITILTDWDRRLTEMHCLRDWFEVRLRLIAAYLLLEKRARAEALGKGLEAKGTEAQDYLTLRRWKRLIDPTHPVCPIPLLADPDAGPYCLNPESTSAVIEEDPSFDAEESEEEIIQTTTPLSEILSGYMQRIMESQEDSEARRELLEEILAHEPSQIQDAGDAAYLVHLSRYVVQGSDDAERVWEWAKKIRHQFSEDATVLNVVALLGHYFLNADPETFQDRILLEQLEKWFRLSLTLNPNHPRNHSRAGAFFLDIHQQGDAERAYSRAFRLDRTDGNAAHQLAEIYRETDRPRDALAVLDLCLRKGTKDAKVAWEAAMTALQLEQYDVVLTYLNRHAKLVDKIPAWHHYYRGLAHFQLGDQLACLRELDQEQKNHPPGQMHLLAIRSCAEAAQGHMGQARDSLKQFLNLRFVDADYLSLHGLVRIAELLCDAVLPWPEEDPLRKQLYQRMLRAGLLSDPYLQSLRDRETETDDIRFYRVQMLQPVSADWKNSEGCLAGQENWDRYTIDWGVLAVSDQDAVDRVTTLQSLCETAVPMLLHVQSGDDTFRDRPGVVWQGYRRHESEESFDAEETME